MLEGIQYKTLKQFLVGHSDFDWITRGAVLLIPGLNKWDVQGSTALPRAEVEGAWCPEETDSIGRVVAVEGPV